MESIKNKSFLSKILPPPKFLAMPSAGIDISDSSIHLIELAQKRNNKILNRFGEYIIPEGVVLGGEVKDVKALSKILAKIKKDYDIHFVRASLPEEKAYLFQTRVPNNIPENDIFNILEFKLEEYVPLSSSESVLDYDILPKHNNDAGHLDVGVVVYPKQTIEQYTTAFVDAGLTPLSFEIETQAMTRSVTKDGDDGTYMIVDYGRTKIGFSVVSDGVLSFTSTLEINEDELTNAFVKYLNVETNEINRIKDEEGLINNHGSKELYSTLISIAESLKDNINKHYKYWKTRVDESGNKVDTIEKIILCGGNSNLAGLTEFLSGSLKMPVERANVWVNVFKFDDFIPEMNRLQSLSYATAIGLALRGVK